MGVHYEYTADQRENQAAIVKRLFRLPDVNQVGVDFTIEAMPGGKALLKMELLELIDMDTANKLLNGLPEAEPGSEPTA